MGDDEDEERGRWLWMPPPLHSRVPAQRGPTRPPGKQRPGHSQEEEEEEEEEEIVKGEEREFLGSPAQHRTVEHRLVLARMGRTNKPTPVVHFSFIRNYVC